MSVYVQPQGVGIPLLYVTIIMLAVSWLTLVTRVFLRLSIKQLGPDDYSMCFGLLLYTVTAGLVIACCFLGSGQKAAQLPLATRMLGTKVFFIAEYFYASCTVPIKASICVTLIRIADVRRGFVYTLWAIIGATCSAAIVFISVISTICVPITALWGASAGECSAERNSTVSFFFSAVSIVTDLLLAVLPALLLWNIQMKRRVKASVGVILAMAAFASCATIIRLRYLTLYNDTSEFMFSTGQIGLWSIIEEGIGITAGSMPALRPLLSLSVFGRSSKGGSSSGAGSKGHPHFQLDSDGVGLDTIGGSAKKLAKIRARGGGGGAGGNRAGAAAPGLETIVGGGGGDDGSDDDESQHHILKETRITMVAEPAGHHSVEDCDRVKVLGWESSSRSQ